jgi:hypothetical protein
MDDFEREIGRFENRNFIPYENWPYFYKIPPGPYGETIGCEKIKKQL